MRDARLPLAWWETAALLGVLSGCGGAETPAATPSPGPTPSAAVAPSATAEPPPPITLHQGPATGAPGSSEPPPDAPPADSASPPAAPPGPYRPPPDALAECPGEGPPNVLRSLVPSLFSYVELRMVGRVRGEPMMAAGVPCEGATDAAACNRKLEGVMRSPRGAGFHMGCRPMSCSHLMFFTRGDEVGSLGTPEEVIAALAPISSRDEAMLVAFASDYQFPECGALEKTMVPMGKSFRYTSEVMLSDCPITTARRVIGIDPQGAIRTLSQVKLPGSGGCVGRRTPGLLARDALAATAEGAELARCFTLEAGAAAAFHRLAVELALHGADPSLVGEALTARDDELRHALITAALAARHGAAVEWPTVQPLPPRSLEALLEDNAAEGCVRESLGALIGLYQAAHARDPVMRAAMGPIAREEVRHAQLSWRLARELEPRLSAAARRRVERAREEAALGLLAGEGAVPSLAALGLPGEDAQRALSGTLARGLLAAAAA